MRRQDFHFHLPQHLIAQHPVAERTASRLLCVDRSTGTCVDKMFKDLPSLLRPGDLLVFNNTRVIPARLYGHKETGGKAEILIERLLSTHEALAMVRCSKSPIPESRIIFEDGCYARVLGRQGEFFHLHFEIDEPLLSWLEKSGHIPLPPYIQRQDAESDKERYQTVYSCVPGAVAAPTAGLHFDQTLIQQLTENGIQQGFVTLHVGAGTFQPVRVDDIRQHAMHSEWLQVTQALTERIRLTKDRGGRVIAVGTTAVRALESAAGDGDLGPFEGDTNIFIYPGYEFKVIDAMITNFHLPESTLIMLVSAFAGYQHTMAAYHHAVEQEYRFFSYGDAMFISDALA